MIKNKIGFLSRSFEYCLPKMDNWLWMYVVVGFSVYKHAGSLVVTEIYVPTIIDFRDNVTLTCSYDMGGHTLNSVKWYKDEKEFFRYSPMMHPVYLKFPVDGIQVSENSNICNETTCRVDLSLLGKRSSGVYRCEVSEDAPHFKLTTKSANMTVAALPQNNPLISSFHSMYHIDEFVTANCSSDYSSPPATLTWYINGEQALYGELQPRIEHTIPAHDYNLRRQILQTHFYLNGPRFYNPTRVLELKCVAEIENFPTLRRETVLNAILVQDDNLNNQMLLSSGYQNKSGHISPQTILLFVNIILASLLHRISS